MTILDIHLPRLYFVWEVCRVHGLKQGTVVLEQRQFVIDLKLNMCSLMVRKHILHCIKPFGLKIFSIWDVRLSLRRIFRTSSPHKGTRFYNLNVTDSKTFLTNFNLNKVLTFYSFKPKWYLYLAYTCNLKKKKLLIFFVISSDLMHKSAVICYIWYKYTNSWLDETDLIVERVNKSSILTLVVARVRSSVAQ